MLQADNPMTVRQVFYQLVSRGVIAKTEAEYKQAVVRAPHKPASGRKSAVWMDCRQHPLDAQAAYLLVKGRHAEPNG